MNRLSFQRPQQDVEFLVEYLATHLPVHTKAGIFTLPIPQAAGGGETPVRNDVQQGNIFRQAEILLRYCEAFAEGRFVRGVRFFSRTSICAG